MQSSYRSHAVTLSAGLAGAALATLAGIPAGALIGSTLAVAGAASAGFRVALPKPVRDLAFTVIGISLGSGVDRGLFGQIGTWSVSLSILIASLIATIMTGRWILTRGFGLDARTATLASTPGTMANVIAVAADGRGDATAVMFLQVMRLMVLMIAVPPIAVAFDAQGGGQIGAMTTMQPLALAGLLAVALAVGLPGSWLGLPAAGLLAGMIVSAAAHASGIVEGMAPGWAIFAAFAITGAVLGTRMSGVTAAQVGRYAFAGAVTVGAALVVSLVFAGLALAVTDLPFGQVWIAYAPGGVEAMAAIGLSLGYDPAFVAIHHFARIFALVLILPVALRV